MSHAICIAFVTEFGDCPYFSICLAASYFIILIIMNCPQQYFRVQFSYRGPLTPKLWKLYHHGYGPMAINITPTAPPAPGPMAPWPHGPTRSQCLRRVKVGAGPLGGGGTLQPGHFKLQWASLGQILGKSSSSVVRFPLSLHHPWSSRSPVRWRALAGTLEAKLRGLALVLLVALVALDGWNMLKPYK